jgi:Thermostable hemolysin
MYMPVSCREGGAPRVAGVSTVASRLFEHPPGDPRRHEVETFIARIYADRFGARVRHFAPVLVSLRDADGIVAAGGYRAATHEPLFLERYLSAPVEALLAAGHGTPPARERIVEVGHLAAARAGEGRRLIRRLAPHLTALGFEWVVSTLTEELRHLFVRIGVAPVALGTADPAVLGDDASHWGSYYDHHPMVLAGNLRQALQQFARRPADSGVSS